MLKGLASLFVLALLILTASLAAGQSAGIVACGSLSAFEAPSAGRPIGTVILNEAGRQRSFQVTGQGTVTPPDIAAIGTGLTPVLAELRGTPRADGVLTDFSLTQVTTCPAASSLPNTSTLNEPSALVPQAWVVFLILLGATSSLITIRGWRLIRRSG